MVCECALCMPFCVLFCILDVVEGEFGRVIGYVLKLRALRAVSAGSLRGMCCRRGDVLCDVCWRMCAVYYRGEVALFLEVQEVMRCALLCIPEVP